MVEPGWLLGLRVPVLCVLLAGVWAQWEVIETVSVEFGQDVNLTCRPDLDDVHWYMKVSGGIRVAILRTFNKKVKAPNFFVYASDRIKYSTLLRNVLVIHKVSPEDCMVYYCGQKNNFTSEFHLLPVTTSTQWWEQKERVLVGSLSLNAFFLLMIAGLMIRRKKTQQTDDLSPPVPLSPEVPEYEEIMLMEGTPGPLASELSCVYSKAQMPVSTASTLTVL